MKIVNINLRADAKAKAWMDKNISRQGQSEFIRSAIALVINYPKSVRDNGATEANKALVEEVKKLSTFEKVV